MKLDIPDRPPTTEEKVEALCELHRAKPFWPSKNRPGFTDPPKCSGEGVVVTCIAPCAAFATQVRGVGLGLHRSVFACDRHADAEHQWEALDPVLAEWSRRMNWALGLGSLEVKP